MLIEQKLMYPVIKYSLAGGANFNLGTYLDIKL